MNRPASTARDPGGRQPATTSAPARPSPAGRHPPPATRRVPPWRNATRRRPRDATRHLERDPTRRADPVRRDGCAPGAVGRSRSGPAGTRSAVRCAAGRPGTGSCARPGRPDPSRVAARYAWPTLTRPIRARRGCTAGHPDYAGEVDHAALIRRLLGLRRVGAVHLRPKRCPACWPCARPGYGWRPGTAANGPPRSRWPLHAWEPVIYAGGRQIIRDRLQPRRVDSIVCGVAPVTTLPGRVIGAKPAAVCRWIFDLLGAGPGDTLDDLFPGSGAVTRAWAAYTGHEPSRPSPTDATAPGQPGPGGRGVVTGPGRRVVPDVQHDAYQPVAVRPAPDRALGCPSPGGGRQRPAFPRPPPSPPHPPYRRGVPACPTP